MSLGHQIRSGVKWLAFGKIGHRVLEFVFGIILARLLVPADFGMIATIAVFTGLVGMFTSGGMGQSLIRAKSADENDFTAVFTLQLALGIAVYLAFFVLAPLISDFLENPLYTDLIRVSALTFLLRPFAVMRYSWLNRQMAFKGRSLVDVASELVAGLASSVMAWAGMGVWSLTLSGLLGGLVKNIWLAGLTPLKPRLNLDFSAIRRHGAYGSMIVANDFVNHLRLESKNLILSKMAGPAFLGLFNKGESLSRLPNQMLMSPTMEPLFRALGSVQDNLDQSKYLYYRAITLLMAYTMPIYVLLWWIAEPFVGVVYGEKWLQAAGPLRILVIAGIFLNIIYPCGAVLAAQGRLKQELAAQSINLPVLIGACVVGLEWGLTGVSWGIVTSYGLLGAHFYLIVRRLLPTRTSDLFKAAAPGLTLGAIMMLALTGTHLVVGNLESSRPVTYLLAMSAVGAFCYAVAFLLLPLPALKAEADRWRRQLNGGIDLLKALFPSKHD